MWRIGTGISYGDVSIVVDNEVGVACLKVDEDAVGESEDGPVVGGSNVEASTRICCCGWRSRSFFDDLAGWKRAGGDLRGEEEGGDNRKTREMHGRCKR